MDAPHRVDLKEKPEILDDANGCEGKDQALGQKVTHHVLPDNKDNMKGKGKGVGYEELEAS